MSERKDTREREETKGSRDTVLVTKESLTAVFALFCVLALLILFTDSLVFGVIGEVVHNFLLGTFGYFAYPLFLGGLYLSVTSFMDKRFVKNRYVFTAFVVAVLCVLLVLQTMLTYSWDLSNYAEECFSAGSEFSSATLLGFFGGLTIVMFSSFLSKIGTMVLFSALCLVAIYFVAVGLSGKGILKNKEKTERKASVTPPVTAEPRRETYREEMPESPLGEEVTSAYRATETSYPPMYREFDSTYAPQRPRFKLDDRNAPPSYNSDEREYGRASSSSDSRTYYPTSPSGGGHSPFGYRPIDPRPEPIDPVVPADPKARRDFLLGGTSDELYRQNLIYDENSRVNKRTGTSSEYSVEETRSVDTLKPETPSVSEGFSSYTHSYEEGFERGDRIPKVVTERPTFGGRDYTERSSFDSPTVARGEIPPRSEEPTYRREESSFDIPETPTSRDTFGFDRGVDRGIERGFGERGFDRGSLYSDDSTGTPTEETPKERTSYFDVPEDDDISSSFRETYTVEDPEDKGFSGRGDFSDFGRLGEFGRGTAESVGRDPFASERDVRGFEEETSRYDEETFGIEPERDPLHLFDEKENEEEDASMPSVEPRRVERDFPAFPERSTERARGIDSVRFTSTPIGREESERNEVEPEEPPKPKKPLFIRPYTPAPLNYMDCSDIEPSADSAEVERAKDKILSVYESFGISNITISSVTFGPTITRYNFVAPLTIAHSKLGAPDIVKALAMELRCSKGINIFPNYDDGVISIEVPNKDRQPVQLGCLLTGPEYINATPNSLVFAIGKDVGNKKLYGDIRKMTHLLVAGATGSGKSVFLTTLIISLINHYSPQQLRLILIDPKKTEFAIYQNLPHLMINEIITEPRKAVQSLGWAIGEMNRRFELFAEMTKKGGTRVVDVDEYNASLPEGVEKLPKIVIIVDELADLMLSAKKEVEERIQNITQKSRAAGIHMVIATQRPSTNVITGVIKANLPTRIAFTVATDVDSRVILDASGAQKLLGRGDMLYCTSGQLPLRAQCAYISSADTQNVVQYIRDHNDSYFDEDATDFIMGSQNGGGDEESGGGEAEAIFVDALRVAVREGSISISKIQRKFSVGYSRAGKIIEWMADRGYVSEFDGAKARKCLLSKEEFETLYGPL